MLRYITSTMADESRLFRLTHWGWVTQICVSKFIIIGSDNGLSPIRRQTIIWTNAGILLIRTLGTNFSEILIQINTFSNKKMHLKMPSGKCRPFCLGLNVLTDSGLDYNAVVNKLNKCVLRTLHQYPKAKYSIHRQIWIRAKSYVTHQSLWMPEIGLSIVHYVLV